MQHYVMKFVSDLRHNPNPYPFLCLDKFCSLKSSLFQTDIFSPPEPNVQVRYYCHTFRMLLFAPPGFSYFNLFL